MTQETRNDMVLFRIGLLEEATKDQFLEIKRLNGEIVKLRLEEDAKERRQLAWGISALGAAVITLSSLIWAYRGVIFK